MKIKVHHVGRIRKNIKLLLTDFAQRLLNVEML